MVASLAERRHRPGCMGGRRSEEEKGQVGRRRKGKGMEWKGNETWEVDERVADNKGGRERDRKGRGNER